MSGTFTVNATDGVASITVLGNNFVPGGVLPQDIDTDVFRFLWTNTTQTQNTRHRHLYDE